MPVRKTKATGGKPGRQDAQGRATRVLREQFGIASLRPGQADVMASVLHGNDTIAVMPTGSGKSLCYQVPALCLTGLTVVVSPLIALMKDQDEKLAERGVDAAVFNSAMPHAEQSRQRNDTAQHRHSILFATPERLADAGFIQWLKEQTISLLVVDEAHCISQWGHDFRPAYLEIPAAVKALGSPPILAMTATATDRVIQDIAESLSLRAACVIRVGVYRANLHYAVRQVVGEESKQAVLRELLEETPGPAIVYTSTVKEAVALYEMLRETHGDVALYHGRLSSARRSDAQDSFMHGKVRIMVATEAFGMGVDKADVRLVVHAQLPGSLDTYYQESGRAGRDGEVARCVLIHEEKDKRIQQFFLANRYPSEELLTRVVQVLGEAAGALPLSALQERLPDTGLRKLQVGTRLLADAGILARSTGRAGNAIIRLAAHAAEKEQGDRVLHAAQAARAYRERAEADRQTLEAMVHYARSGSCRWRMLLAHFGEQPEWDRCNTCDSCKLAQAAETAVQAGDLPESEQPHHEPAALRVGDGVRVRRYGAGVVEAVTREKVDIRFPNGDLRRFLPGYVRRLKRKPPVPAVANEQEGPPSDKATTLRIPPQAA